mmetsp:Transcript_12748/g.46629  ORF Transcript_12748/g.46629 Transcript_12748/m.46629 type:complete len:419 (-) Transcript_12748:606-1862(-)
MAMMRGPLHLSRRASEQMAERERRYYEMSRYAASKGESCVGLGVSGNAFAARMFAKKLGWSTQERVAQEDVCGIQGDKIVGQYHFGGPPEFRRALLTCLNSVVYPKASRKLEDGHLWVANGVTTLLEGLAFALCDDGDAVLVPAPFYNGFTMDLCLRAGARIVPVYRCFDDRVNVAETLRESYENASQESDSTHSPVRALLLCNPDNPTGRCLTKAQLRECLNFCVSNAVHLICDEIYALSTYDEPGFVSILDLQLTEKERKYVHVLWGFSKDFGAAGVRLGCIYTENTDVIHAIKVQTRFMATSSSTLYRAVGTLQSTASLQEFVDENKSHLRATADRVKGVLAEQGIRFVNASGGLFLFIDLGEFLDAQTWEAEAALTNQLIQAGVFMTPGQECYAERPGFYRCCFASVDDDTLVI